MSSSLTLTRTTMVSTSATSTSRPWFPTTSPDWTTLLVTIPPMGDRTTAKPTRVRSCST